MSQIFSILATAITIYTMFCFIRILLTWFSGAQYSSFGRFLSNLCDPYLNIFRRLSFLRIGMMDFSAAVGICVLVAASSICSHLALSRTISFASVLGLLVSLSWSIISSVIGILAVIFIIRFVVIMVKGDYSTYGSLWDQLDRALSPIIFRISNMFYRRGTPPFKTGLLISILTLAAAYFIGNYLIRLLVVLISQIPF